MSILKNTSRVGKFTSSEIWKLMKEGKKKGEFGAPAITYIKERMFERKLGRSLSTDVKTQPIIWGKFLEPRVHDLLPLTYEHTNDITLDHPRYAFWKGSPDNKEESSSTICDTKCPQPKAFCNLVENISKGVEVFKEEHEEYYWQLVSNAIITGSKNIELIVYMPFEDEIPEIQKEAYDYIGELDPWRIRFIYESSKHELPYIGKDSGYTNLNRFRFPLDAHDAERLTANVVKANTMLNSLI